MCLLIAVLIVVVGVIVGSWIGVKIDIVLLYALIVMLFVLIPEVLDIILAYYTQNKTRKRLIETLIEKASHDELKIDELKEFIAESGKAPSGILGLTRGLIALTVILILGISILHLLTKCASTANSQIISNILSTLSGLLAAITGFYFGGRTAENILSAQTQPKK